MQLEKGSRLGPYEVVEAIGSGGMGEVYRARDVRLERDVALKILSRRLESDSDAVARFEREAKAVAALSHPNILAIHDFAVDQGRPYTVTELLEGESLRARLGRGPVGWREAAAMGVSIAEGLSAAHAKGIVHRDLKPENLFVVGEDRMKILDFGLAATVDDRWRPREVDDPSAPTMATPVDQAFVVGTIGYMSPEQSRGLPVGPASDIFSLGCVLYEMVTGHRAFERETVTDTIAAVLHEPPLALGESGRHVPPELARVIMHCLEKDQGRRFQSARDAAFALRIILDDSAIQTVVPRGKSARQKAVAVLPFVNDTGDAELDYVSDGLAESLINTLTAIPRLRVVPRALAFRYRARRVDPHTIGVELNATMLVSGRLTKRGDQLSVQAEMVDTASESQLWGQRFVRATTDLFAMQEALAEEIGQALEGRLSRRRTKTPVHARSQGAKKVPDATAYAHYLRGRFYWNRWTPSAFGQAITCFEAAIAIDPGFAAAWAGLGDALGAAGYFGFLPAAEAMPRALMAAEQAIRLDDALADGHAARGVSLLFWRRDFAAAGEAFRHAVQRNPGHPLTRAYYSLYLATQRQFDESLAQAREAEKLDPVTPVIVMSVAWALHFAGRHEDALRQIHRLLELDPSSIVAQGMLAGTHEQLRQYDAAITHMEPWLATLKVGPEECAGLRRTLQEHGERGYWEARLDLFRRMKGCGCGDVTFGIAEGLIRLGDLEGAIDQLDEAYAAQQGAIVFFGAEPSLVALHGHPRYEALLAKVGLPGTGSSVATRGAVFTTLR